MMASTHTEPIVQAENLTKVFRDFWRRPKVRALRGISFEVRPGEVFGLLGPNGSGKSTTLKLILGLLYPTGGQLRVLGRSPRDVRAKARLGYLPEESCLYPYLTPEETLSFFGNLFDLSPTDQRERIEQLLDMTGLRAARRRAVGEFSKGMARRIGLAQALINDPDLIVLDEPTSGLDPVGCRQVKDLIRALARRGKTVLLSSHLLADVEDVCDRIAILFDGRIQAMGSIHDLLEEAERLRLTLPDLPAEQMNRLAALIREYTGQEPTVEHPRRDLERYFLDVVAAAHREEQEPSGAAPTEGVARYLTQPEPERPDERLQRLVVERPQASKEQPEETSKPDKSAAPAADAATGEAVDRKLEGLVRRPTSGEPLL